MPPIAHIEPWVMVSHRLRSNWICSCCPARMRSMTSTPRVEPMRQGVHLPQDSLAQNYMA